MENPILKYSSEITDQQVRRLDKLEGLIRLRDGLQEDLESIEEIVSEVIEQREEEASALGLSLDEIKGGLTALKQHYTNAKNEVQKIRLAAMDNK